MRKSRGILGLTILGIIGLAVGGAVMWKVSTTEDAAETAPRAATGTVPVEVVPVRLATVRDIRRLSGTVFPQSEVTISPRIAGRLMELTVDIGDRVEKGQILARLDDSESRQAVEQSRAEVEVARASLDQAQSELEINLRDFERVEQLFGRNVVSEQELDAARSTMVASRSRVEVTKAQLNQQEAALRAAEIRLSYTVIHANWSEEGAHRVVGERFVDEGTQLSANTAIVSLLDIDQLRAVVYVTERDYARLREGQEAIVRADVFPDRPKTGRITRMAPLFREASRQARLEINVPNEDHLLRPGMFIRSEILIEVQENVPVVPLDGLVERRGSQGVFIADTAANTASFVVIKPGIIEGDVVQILEPELNGPVVVLGQHLLSDGAAIRIATQAEVPVETPEGETRASVTASPAR